MRHGLVLEVAQSRDIYEILMSGWRLVFQSRVGWDWDGLKFVIKYLGTDSASLEDIYTTIHRRLGT